MSAFTSATFRHRPMCDLSAAFGGRAERVSGQSVPLRTLLRHDAMFRAKSAFGGFWSVSLIFSLRVGRTKTR